MYLIALNFNCLLYFLFSFWKGSFWLNPVMIACVIFISISSLLLVRSPNLLTCLSRAGKIWSLLFFQLSFNYSYLYSSFTEHLLFPEMTFVVDFRPMNSLFFQPQYSLLYPVSLLPPSTWHLTMFYVSTSLLCIPELSLPLENLMNIPIHIRYPSILYSKNLVLSFHCPLSYM